MIIVVKLGRLVFTDFTSKTRQAACRKAFKAWIKQEQIKRQPKSSDEGWWKGVSAEVLKKV